MNKFVNLIVLLAIFELVIFSCKSDSGSSDFSNDPKIIFEGNAQVANNLVGLKDWISEEVIFNGHPSIKLDSAHKYGLSVILENVVPDAFVRITVWRKSESNNGLIALTGGEINFFRYGQKIIESGKNGWKKITLEAFIPPLYKDEKLNVFVWNNKKSAVYFSDLNVTVYYSKPYPVYKEKNTIEFLIDEKNISYIKEKRKESFLKGVITKKNKKEFDASVVIDGVKYPITIRIKGDWLDHLQTDKWSFRIKMKEGNFKGMKEFSIQQPGTREFLNEWVIHKLFESEDVLTTRYGFVPIKINGKSTGIYAYEEHFEKGLVEYNKRREGPIIKFNEDAMWFISAKNVKNKEGSILAPVVESSIIKPFKKKKTMRSETLNQQFLIGQNLLNQYRYDDMPISDLFKINQLAKFYALTNIGRAAHPVRWHNERFYYDPVASKLEIIAYDCYSPGKLDQPEACLNPNVIYGNPYWIYDKYLAHSPFNDTIFLQKYIEVIEEYLKTNKLLLIMDKEKEQIKRYEKWLQKEYSHYHYNYDFISSSIDILKPQLEFLKNKLKKTPLKANLKIKDYNYGKSAPVEGFMLQAFNESNNVIRVRNFHSKQMYLIGYSSKKQAINGIIHFEKPIKFKAYKSLSNLDKKNIICQYSPDKIYFKENLNDSLIYDIKVMPWPEPGHDSPRQELLRKAVKQTTNFAVVSNDTVTFKAGKFTINEPIVISEGKRVIINQETHLDFIEGAFFLSFSPVEIKGNTTKKVILESSDGTARGFTVVGSDEESEIEYTRFEGWNTLDYNGWVLTGAITFYESDVTIAFSEFVGNNCEDALNIIRSDFLFKNSIIANAPSDGFDADYTTGLVYGCDFKQIGNDGIDISGSEISIENVKIDGAGDKGISGGEASTLYLKNVAISNSNIGIASKDDSNLKIENIKLINCNCGFAAYQKKTEYGPSKMTIEGCEMKNVGDVYMIGLESVINIDRDVNRGTIKLNVDSLYAL
jgi:hypothetical protein